MLTLTSEYALRALIYLTQHKDDGPIPGRTIAAQAGIPAKYLSKILGDLVKQGILKSSPGKTGGFHLRRDPKKTSLFKVLGQFEQFDKKRCHFGNRECSDARPCLAHDRWKKIIEAERRFLQDTTIYEISIDAKSKRRSAGRR